MRTFFALLGSVFLVVLFPYLIGVGINDSKNFLYTWMIGLGCLIILTVMVVTVCYVAFIIRELID